MSADTIKKKSNSNYDIDDFINQLLSSQKFDELAEKVAEKAASKIRYIEASQPRLERFFDENKVNKNTDAQNYRDYDNEPEAYNSHFQLRKDGKIDTHAVMDETTSHAENLKLKYIYLTRNAYEKATDSDHNSLPRNEKNDDTWMQNQDHDHKANDRDEDATDKNKHGSENDYEPGDSWRLQLRNDDNKDSSLKRESKHSNTRNDDRNQSQVDKKSDTENGTVEEETPSTVEEHHTENSVSAEKTHESIQKEVNESSSEVKAEGVEPAPFQFRAETGSLPNVDENKVTADRAAVKQEDQKVLDVNSKNSSRKPIIRREGDKLFTFVESPDYADYHQEMAKLTKDEMKSPADFLVF